MAFTGFGDLQKLIVSRRHLGVCIGIACCPGFARVVAAGEQGCEGKAINQCESVETMIAFCLRHGRQFLLQSDDHPRRVEFTISGRVLYQSTRFFERFICEVVIDR